MMRKLVPILAALILGIPLGWFLGYSISLVKTEREFCRKANMTPDELRALIQKNREVVSSIDEDNSSTAILSLYTLLKLQAGDTTAVKDRTIVRLVQYYRSYGPPDESNRKQSDRQRTLLKEIEQANQIIPELKTAMENKAEPPPAN
jgi:hypothetical protein